MNNLGSKIKQLREKHNLTQKALAEQLGVSAQAVSKWETNVNEPDVSTIRRLCKIFGIGINEFLEENTPPPSFTPIENTVPPVLTSIERNSPPVPAPKKPRSVAGNNRREFWVVVCSFLAAILSFLGSFLLNTVPNLKAVDFISDGNVIARVKTNGKSIRMPKNPTKDEYVFDGWYLDNEKWEKVFTLSSLLNQNSQDATHYKVYAKWKSTVHYTVVFSSELDSTRFTQQIKYGEPTALRINTFSYLSNYVFSHWKADKDVYLNGETVLNLCKPGEEIHLQAVWKYYLDRYTVVFDANGGVGSMPNQIIERNKTVALSKNTFTRGSYTFMGWSTSANGGGWTYTPEELVENLAPTDGTITLYAQWKAVAVEGKTYTVWYMENNGTIKKLDEMAFRFGVSEMISCHYYAPDMHVFVGWNTKADGTGRTYQNGSEIIIFDESVKTIVLYAQYKKVENEPVGDVYYIDDYDDLLLIKNDLAGTYVLTKDIELPSSENYVCGTLANPFEGKFFGHGYTISGIMELSGRTDKYCGLFGYIGENGWIENLNLKLSIGSSEYSAAFAYCNKGTIINCLSTGSYILANEYSSRAKDLYVGGIVVFNEGTIKNTLSTANITGTALTKNLQMGGICVKNTGTIENCAYIHNTQYLPITPIKYNDACSVQIDALFCVNEGVSKNNYYLNGMRYVIEKGSYEDNPTYEIYESGVLTSSYGKGVDTSSLSSKSFFVNTLGWSEDVWDFSDVSNKKYPTLKELP